MTRPKFSAPYSQIADEYYDAALHKTSRNFDDAARETLRTLSPQLPANGLVLDVGCGRGRCGEYLGIDSSRVVHLDSSQAMLELMPRENSLLRICHQAEELPFLDCQFSVVSAFLCDPFLGLNFLAEAHRVLSSGGILVGTTPSPDWGVPLRRLRGLDERTTQFINRGGQPIILPSTLVSDSVLFEMLELVGFCRTNIKVAQLPIPQSVAVVSDDISIIAKMHGRCEFDVPVLISFTAQKN